MRCATTARPLRAARAAAIRGTQAKAASNHDAYVPGPVPDICLHLVLVNQNLAEYLFSV